jgi:hypothetical protein
MTGLLSSEAVETRDAVVLQQSQADRYASENALHEETTEDETVNEEIRTNLADINDDVEKSQHRNFQTDIPLRFSQPSDTRTRGLSDMLRGTSGMGGVASRNVFPPSDHMLLSTTNRSVYDTEHSVRFRDVDPRDNVTVRETKRPQERPKDKEYRRRYSSSSRENDVSEPRGGFCWPREGENGRRMSMVTVEQDGAQFPQFRQRSPALSVDYHHQEKFKGEPKLLSPLIWCLRGNRYLTGFGRQCLFLSSSATLEIYLVWTSI